MFNPEYNWKNLETGGSGVSKFNASHDVMFAEPKYHPERALERKADELIASWNRQQPKTWRYWR